MEDESAKFYDDSWERLSDFIRHNFGARHRRRIILSLLRQIRFSTVLDVGCGPAMLLQAVAAHYPAAELTGIDIAAATLELAAARLPMCRFLAADLNALPDSLAGAGGFELVLCSEVIEHLEDQRGAMANLACLTKTGGHLLVTCPAGPIFETERRFGHLHHPSLSELVRYAGDAGLHLRHTLVWGFPVYYASKRIINLSPAWSMSRFGDGRYSLWRRAVNEFFFLMNFLNLPNSSRGCQLFCLFQKLGAGGECIP